MTKGKKRASAAQLALRARVFSLSVIIGFSLFGLYISFDTYTDPGTRSLSTVVLWVSLIGLVLTVMNVVMVRVRIRRMVQEQKRKKGAKRSL